MKSSALDNVHPVPVPPAISELYRAAYLSASKLIHRHGFEYCSLKTLQPSKRTTTERLLNVSADSAALRQANQFRYASNPHFLHHVGTMDFDRLLDRAEVAGNLFV